MRGLRSWPRTSIAIWPAPIPGITSGADGFDWSRVDAAIAAIPAGRWTNYGALAELAGTSAQAVGNYVPTTLRRPMPTGCCPPAGAVSESFRWSDENDEREPRQVLEAEGVSFSDDGYASADQWLSPEELATLVEAPEEALDEDSTLAPTTVS